MTVIDVHTHMLNDEWLARIKQHGGPHYSVKEFKGQQVVHMDGAPFMTLQDGMFDYDLRIKNMDQARVDLAIVSLTCPSVYWGDEAVSAESARLMNHDMAAQQTAYPDRIRWFATLPWLYPDLALAELERAIEAGAAGIFVLANLAGKTLVDPLFEPIWQAIEARALPVMLHPTTPPGIKEMEMGRLLPVVGFTFDTSLAVGRMVLDGFFDRYTKLKLIACHAGGTLPYLAGRLDLFYNKRIPPKERKIAELPTEHLRRVYYDSITFHPLALKLLIDVGGADKVMFGTDYPHPADIPFLRGLVDDLPADQAKAVLGENARRVFGF